MLFALSWLAVGCGTLPAPAPLPGRIPPYSEGSHFVVVGDLQRTSLLEFWRESNDPERRRIVVAIAAERPAFVAITGDLVFDGGSARQWADFDALMTPIRDAGIPVLATFGNHEYWAGRQGEPRFFARFPHLGGRHHDVVAWGAVRLVFLDSNVEEMSAAEWRAQQRWYQDLLATLDADPEVRGVLVLLHHPPLTNSTVTGDEAHVQRDIVPAFLGANKTLAMLSGHVHSYERFARGGKMFVVSGGGGGPRAALSIGGDRRHPDDLFAGPALRDFEYIRFSVGSAGVDAEVRGLGKGERVFSGMDRFFLPYR